MKYDYMDRVLKGTVKRIYEIFRQYRQMDFDELNIIGQTRELYTRLDWANRDAYEDIARHYYESEPHGDGMFGYLWVEGFLDQPSKTIKYSYSSEIPRKRDRLMEALVATNGDKQEYDKAMRYWTQQTGWFAIEIADEAVKRARIDDGVKRVMWVSEHDDRVCGMCDILNGTIFPIEEVPPKPHPGCRCHLERVSDADE